MKTAIVYATKYGCTKECAEILKTYLHGEVNILSAKADKINLSQYDAVFIGGSGGPGDDLRDSLQRQERKHALHRLRGVRSDRGVRPGEKAEGNPGQKAGEREETVLTNAVKRI